MRNKLFCVPWIVLLLIMPLSYGMHEMVPERLSRDDAVKYLVYLVSTGLLLGVLGVLIHTKMRWYYRLLIAVSYVPVLGFSLVFSGFN